MDAGGGDLTMVHREPGLVFQAPITWTPDGQRLLFWGREGAEETLVSMRPDGSDVRAFAGGLPEGHNLGQTRQGLQALLLDWSADERWIVLSQARGVNVNSPGIPGSYLVRADGGEPFLISNGFEPTWRPDLG